MGFARTIRLFYFILIRCVCMILLLAFKIERFFLRTATKKDERETIKEVEANIVIWFELQKI